MPPDGNTAARPDLDPDKLFPDITPEGEDAWFAWHLVFAEDGPFLVPPETDGPDGPDKISRIVAL